MEGPKSTKNLPVFGFGLGFEWALGLKYPRKATVPYWGSSLALKLPTRGGKGEGQGTGKINKKNPIPIG